ncbi:transposase IS3/IS911 family protein [Acidovorax sp. NO-1]|nr:transposase IS3/IS911 family protein [Acidovorax sp. NO-1]
MVKMVREQNLSVAQVSKDLDLVDSAVRRWLAQCDDEAAGRPVVCTEYCMSISRALV